MAGLARVSSDTSGRHGRDDRWLAVFFEFWAHVIRHPELRGRFAAIHRRVQVPIADDQMTTLLHSGPCFRSGVKYSQCGIALT